MIKEYWIVKDGSIFTDKAYKYITDHKTYYARRCIAFNIGEKLANHLVDLHNVTCIMVKELA